MESLKRASEEPPKTPTKKVHGLPGPSPDTPYSENSVTQRIVTSQLSTEPRNRHIEESRTQKILERLVKAELCGACFQSPDLASYICPDNGRASKVLQDLEQNGCIGIDGERRVSIHDWPHAESKPDERNFYAPFVNLLNHIIDSFGRRFPHEPSYWRSQGVRFHVYDREMKDSVDFAECLKPDLLGVYNCTGPFDNKQCSWLNVEVPCEIKKSWPDLVKQATTYARCAFAAAEHRYFIPAFAFDHKRSIFRLLIFSRSGLVSTEDIVLSEQSGFESFISIIVGMLSWKTELEAGYLDHQTRSHAKLNGTLYRIGNILCRRRGVRGRNTNVYHLLKEPNPENPQIPTSFNPVAKSKELEPLLWSDPEIPRASEQLPFPLPDEFIMKCSNSLASRIKEEEVFKPVQGYIGIVDIVGAYDTDRFCAPADSKSWDVLEIGSSSDPEDRLHRHIILKTCGRQLRTANDPRKLLYAILHAMMGHCALFTQGGYLHRDISHGNILLLPEEETRKIPLLLSEAKIVTSGSCVAVLIDGDVSKRWGETRETSSHRSGTKQFLSIRVTTKWTDNAEVTHTPIDDLESFIWVLVYVLLEKTDRTPMEDGWWADINNDNLKVIGFTKEKISKYFQRSGVSISPYTMAFRPLLSDWFTIAANYEAGLDGLETHDAMKELSLKAYKEFIRTGLKHVSSLPTKWPST